MLPIKLSTRSWMRSRLNPLADASSRSPKRAEAEAWSGPGPGPGAGAADAALPRATDAGMPVPHTPHMRWFKGLNSVHMGQLHCPSGAATAEEGAEGAAAAAVVAGPVPTDGPMCKEGARRWGSAGSSSPSPSRISIARMACRLSR